MVEKILLKLHYLSLYRSRVLSNYIQGVTPEFRDLCASVTGTCYEMMNWSFLSALAFTNTPGHENSCDRSDRKSNVFSLSVFPLHPREHFTYHAAKFVRYVDPGLWTLHTDYVGRDCGAAPKGFESTRSSLPQGRNGGERLRPNAIDFGA